MFPAPLNPNAINQFRPSKYVLRQQWILCPVFLCSIGLWLAGCTPYVYGPEVKKFAGGITAISSADANAKKLLDNDRMALDFLTWTARRDRKLTTVGCIAGGKDCRIISADSTPEEKERNKFREDIDKARSASAPSLKALVTYAISLVAITDANDLQELEGAQVRFQEAAGNLASQLDSPAVTAKFGVLSKLFASLTTSALNRARYKALREAVQTGHPFVELLGSKLGAELNRLNAARIAEVRRQADVIIRSGIRTSSNKKVYSNNLIALSVTTETMRNLQLQNGAAIGSAMVEAHRALRDALVDGSTQTDATFSAIENFAELAKEIVSAFRT